MGREPVADLLYLSLQLGQLGFDARRVALGLEALGYGYSDPRIRVGQVPDEGVGIFGVFLDLSLALQNVNNDGSCGLRVLRFLDLNSKRDVDCGAHRGIAAKQGFEIAVIGCGLYVKVRLKPVLDNGDMFLHVRNRVIEPATDDGGIVYQRERSLLEQFLLTGTRNPRPGGNDLAKSELIVRYGGPIIILAP